MTRLEELLRQLEPDNIKSRVDDVHDKIHASFKIPPTKLDSKTFLSIVNTYYSYHQRASYFYVDGLTTGDKLVEKLYRRREPLSSNAGSSSIFLSMAYEEATNGRLPEILKEMATYIKEEARKKYIQLLFCQFPREEERADMVRELFSKFEQPKHIQTDKPELYADDLIYLALKSIELNKTTQINTDKRE